MVSERVVLAVDGNSLVHRAYHAQSGTGLRSPHGRPIWAVRGLLAQLVAAVERIGPDAVVVGFDDPDSSVRRQRWPQYKATRTDKLPTLVDQLSSAVAVLRQLGVNVVVPTGLEADDVLASVAHAAPKAGARTVIVTSDRDSFSLIDERTSVLRIINGGVEASPLLTPQRLVTMLGIRPDQYRDFAALRGDPSDNLPGVRGIGPKTAARLLNALQTAEAAFDDLDGDGALVTAAIGPSAAARLSQADARTAWRLNCQVMQMQHGVALEMDFNDGPGVLPLAVDAVRTTFEEQQLHATAPSALRVLAHHESDGADLYRYAESRPRDWDPDYRSWSSRPRYGRLVMRPTKPKVEQLSLFD